MLSRSVLPPSPLAPPLSCHRFQISIHFDSSPVSYSLPCTLSLCLQWLQHLTDSHSDVPKLNKLFLISKSVCLLILLLGPIHIQHTAQRGIKDSLLNDSKLVLTFTSGLPDQHRPGQCHIFGQFSAYGSIFKFVLRK